MQKKRPSFRARSKAAFRPYGLAIGEIVLHWNLLHDNLSQLFSTVTGSPHAGLASAVWYSTDNDYQQRKMLRAATEKSARLTPLQRKDVLWLLNEIDDPLRHQRNDAIHAPLAALLGDTKISIIASFASRNPRARSLWRRSNVNLLPHLREQAKWTDILADYSLALVRSLHDDAVPWPEKPRQPHAHRTKSRKGSSRQTPAK